MGHNKKSIYLLRILILTLLINISITNKSIFSYIKDEYVSMKYNKEINYMKNSNYNREKAREYALKWATSSNKEYYNFINDGGDCTNFVSQVLRAGGLDFVGSKANATSIKSWFYYSSNLPNRTSTWTAANPFNLHFGKEYKRAYDYREYKIEDALKNWDNIYSSIYIGDIVQYSRPNNIAFHSQAITDVLDKSTIYFSQHSNSIENFYKNGNLKYYLLGKPDNYNFLIYNIKEEKNTAMRSKKEELINEEDYNKELKEAIDMIKLSIKDTRSDNKEYGNNETDDFLNKMEKKVIDIELQMDMRSKSSKELLESLMNKSGL
ncbi:amidase domain-containing protein [Clostridium nigeriense]|uniref:amidase domain-containing protein n=1 Tax=Clostridium nigeriense TaxID=1805470 RepID=UPI003D332605